MVYQSPRAPIMQFPSLAASPRETVYYGECVCVCVYRKDCGEMYEAMMYCSFLPSAIANHSGRLEQQHPWC